MKKIFRVCALLFAVLSAGLLVACGNSETKTSADSFQFLYVKGSATKTTDETNHNIKIQLNIENKKENENVLAVEKFVLKQNDKKIDKSMFLGTTEEHLETEAFESKKKKDITLNIVADKSVTGECYLYYGDVKLFKVEI